MKFSRAANFFKNKFQFTENAKLDDANGEKSLNLAWTLKENFEFQENIKFSIPCSDENNNFVENSGK